jgi:hypothetical protein
MLLVPACLPDPALYARSTTDKTLFVVPDMRMGLLILCVAGILPMMLAI